MIYAFICRDCGSHHESTSREPTSCSCGSILKRDWRVNIASSFIPHFNYSVGRYVHNRSDFNSALRRASDSASEQTGTTHNYVPVDGAEVMRARKSDEGLYEQAKVQRDSGKVQPTKRTFI